MPAPRRLPGQFRGILYLCSQNIRISGYLSVDRERHGIICAYGPVHTVARRELAGTRFFSRFLPCEVAVADLKFIAFLILGVANSHGRSYNSGTLRTGVVARSI